jgi:hypothetical protein
VRSDTQKPFKKTIKNSKVFRFLATYERYNINATSKYIICTLFNCVQVRVFLSVGDLVLRINVGEKIVEIEGVVVRRRPQVLLSIILVSTLTFVFISGECERLH